MSSRYASADALEKLGEVYREAMGLLEGYYNAFYNETRLAGKGRAEIEEEMGVAALEKDLLQKKIARPLSEPSRHSHHLSASLLHKRPGSGCICTCRAVLLQPDCVRCAVLHLSAE